MAVPILQFVGYSNSGKTTLITDIIERLKVRGYDVFVIKSAHTHSLAPSISQSKLSHLKDSHRFFGAGADTVCVIFNNSIQMYFHKSLNFSSIITALAETLEPDIVIIEGFKQLGFQKILVWSEELNNNNLSSFNLDNLVCIYNDKGQNNILNNKILKKIESGLLVINNPDRLLHFIEINIIG